MQQFFPLLVKNIGLNKPVIFDADGLYYLSMQPELFEFLKEHKTILTPNFKELGLIKPYLNIDLNKINYNKIGAEIEQLPDSYNQLHHFGLIIKGEEDLILGKDSYVVRT